MRERDINRRMFHRGHYEVIAARIREQLERYESRASDEMARRAAIIDLSISLAKRFKLDNDEFDPLIFLDRCSPDAENYPLSELWPGVDQTEVVHD